MKYFIGALFLIGLSLTLSGGVTSVTPVTTQEPEFREIICDIDKDIVCVEHITFPAMYFNAEEAH